MKQEKSDELTTALSYIMLRVVLLERRLGRLEVVMQRQCPSEKDLIDAILQEWANECDEIHRMFLAQNLPNLLLRLERLDKEQQQYGLKPFQGD